MSQSNVVIEDQAITIYRRIANEIFRQDLGTNDKEKLVEMIGLDEILVDATGSTFGGMADEIISESINASLHTLFHWASEYQPSEINETSQAICVVMQLIKLSTQHLCPRHEVGNEK